jgi:hypothetical protein
LPVRSAALRPGEGDIIRRDHQGWRHFADLWFWLESFLPGGSGERRNGSGIGMVGALIAVSRRSAAASSACSKAVLPVWPESATTTSPAPGQARAGSQAVMTGRRGHRAAWRGWRSHDKRGSGHPSPAFDQCPPLHHATWPSAPCVPDGSCSRWCTEASAPHKPGNGTGAGPRLASRIRAAGALP